MVALQLAVDETLLRGDTEAARVSQAEKTGIQGIEYRAEGLAERIPNITTALGNSSVVASSVHLGTDYNFLAVEESQRQQALDALRVAMTHAVDIGAKSVVLVPHVGATLGLPDLMPYQAPIQLAVELMVWHLRSLSDLAYVFGVTLYMQPRNRYETAFLNRLSQGVELRRRIKFHKHVLLAADTYHMSISETNPIEALQTHHDSVGMVYLADTNGMLPGQGMTDFGTIANACTESCQWAVITGYGLPEKPAQRDLQISVNFLRESGF